MKEKIEELSKSFAAVDEKLKKIKADDYNSPERTKVILEGVMYSIRNIHDRMDYLSREFYNYYFKHQEGHIPPIKTASQMQKALKAIGMEDDFEVKKPNLYISASAKKGLTITASYNKK